MFISFFNLLKIPKYFVWFSDLSRRDKKTLGRYGFDKKAAQVQYLFFLHNQESNCTSHLKPKKVYRGTVFFQQA